MLLLARFFLYNKLKLAVVIETSADDMLR